MSARPLPGPVARLIRQRAALGARLLLFLDHLAGEGRYYSPIDGAVLDKAAWARERAGLEAEVAGEADPA